MFQPFLNSARAFIASTIRLLGCPLSRITELFLSLSRGIRSKPTSKLYVLAHHFVPWYRYSLTNLVHRLGLQQYVHLMENPPGQDLLNLYVSSKIILSTAHFEPFGMSVAEGMMLRAVPVVYKGPLSGPWIDIVDKGRYGIGFRTIEEFAESIEYIMNANGTELLELQEKACKGSQRFSFDKFERNITRLLK